jgi:Domain of unknown function (DUF4296)
MRLKIFLLTFLFTACSSDDKPKNLIPEDKMAKVLTEIHILEAQINNLHFQHEDSSVYVYQKKRFELMKTLDLDTASFKVSLKYYMLNPDKMKAIYVEVKRNLEAKKKVIEAKKAIEDKKKKAIEDKKILEDKKKGILPKKIGVDSIKKPLIPINKFKIKLSKKVTPNPA